MRLCTPDYYDSFTCIAGACPDSCCKEWDVLVDPDKAAFYRSLPGNLGDRLRQVLKTAKISPVNLAGPGVTASRPSAPRMPAL